MVALGTMVIVGAVAVVGLVLIAFLIWGFRKAIELFFNSLIGFFALWVTQLFFLPELLINVWSVLIVAVAGILGFIVVLALHLLGIAF